jgi:phenylalanine-4-hydroxylase|tara:strand:+ start:1952 stop:2665 length:714 start_codon:yes stop_codon:yes gene_type:complete
MPVLNNRVFTAAEIETWKDVLSIQEKTRERDIVDIFNSGLKALNIRADKIPQLSEVNDKLEKITGFNAVYVPGLENGKSFYPMLENRTFPIGNFIRDKRDLSYTPEPDMIHDLYGHIPLLTDIEYADFCHKFGQAACNFINNDDLFHRFERFFWFTIEFGLINTSGGPRVFGAGIASSIGECDYALSSEPEVINFDIDLIINQEFRIDQMQKKLFILESKHQLYGCIDELVEKIKAN